MFWVTPSGEDASQATNQTVRPVTISASIGQSTIAALTLPPVLELTTGTTVPLVGGRDLGGGLAVVLVDVTGAAGTVSVASAGGHRPDNPGYPVGSGAPKLPALEPLT